MKDHPTTTAAPVLRSEDPPQYEVAMAAPTSSALMLDQQVFSRLEAVAKMMAKGKATVPRHLQGNEGDCLAVTMQAAQWRMNPFAVAQKTHLVNGTLGYEAQLVNAVVNTMAPTKDRINYEWFGPWEKVMGKFEERTSKKKVDDDTGQPLKYRVPAWNIADEAGLGIRVWATMKGEDKPRELTLLLVQCRVRNSPLWADDPRQQIAYLAVKRWTRLHCPDVLLGVYTPDELQVPVDMGQVEEHTPRPSPALVAAAETAAREGVAAYQRYFIALNELDRALLKVGGNTSEHERLKQVAVDADKKRTVDAPATPKPSTTPAPSPTPEAAAAPTATPAPPAADDGAPSWAQLMDRIKAANDDVALMLCEDWIAEWKDETQKAELAAAVTRRRGELGIGGAK